MVGRGEVAHGIIRRLARRPGHWVSRRDIIDVVYSDREDGGPMNPENVIAKILSDIGPRLLAHGWKVEGGRGMGGNGCYRLVLA